ncbi:MAG: hypothetical protein IT361_00510 [Gemmatimonadaceae bacterium]|nr:hypothetical protein [Gemmatimonadaceae bacterium]
MQTQNDVRREIRDGVRHTVREVAQVVTGPDGPPIALGQGVGTGPVISVGPDGPVIVTGAAQRQAMLDALRGEIAAARAEIEQLTNRFTTDLSNAREQALSMQLDAAAKRMQLLQLRYDELATQGTGSIRVPPPAERPAIPPDVRNMVQWLTGTVAITIVSIVLIRSVVRWFEKRQERAPLPSDLGTRLGRMEQAIEAVAIEVERISESQRYTTKVLNEGRTLPAPAPAESWPAAAEREALPVRSSGQK